MKMILTSATTPDGYFEQLAGWQAAFAIALRCAVRETVPEFDERLKWGHAVYFLNGPALLIRAEPGRVLFTFWRGQRLRGIEPRLKPGGRYEMATLELKPDTPLTRAVVERLASQAARLNRALGDPTASTQSTALRGPDSPSPRPPFRRQGARPLAGEA